MFIRIRASHLLFTLDAFIVSSLTFFLLPLTLGVGVSVLGDVMSLDK